MGARIIASFQQSQSEGVSAGFTTMSIVGALLSCTRLKLIKILTSLAYYVHLIPRRDFYTAFQATLRAWCDFD
jgi:hypothetical protein